MLVILRNAGAQTTARAATLRQKLQVTLSTSPSHRILTPGQPVPPGRVATGQRIFQRRVYNSTWKKKKKNYSESGNRSQVCRSGDGHLNH